jgi:hypothetical protein
LNEQGCVRKGFSSAGLIYRKIFVLLFTQLEICSSLSCRGFKHHIAGCRRQREHSRWVRK